MMSLGDRVQAVRGFNRFYTKRIGVLRRGWLDSAFSLAEARVLYEIAHREQSTATDLARALDLDRGYLSRLLRVLGQRGLVDRVRARTDGRQAHLSLTSRGRTAFALLDRKTREDVASSLRGLPSGDQRRLVSAMQVIQDVFDEKPRQSATYVLRPPRSGDLGWIVHRQGVLYAEEWGYDGRFEALVAEIVASFVRNLRPSKERCWIAESHGEIVGCVFLVRESDSIARLRLLYVEPAARKLGIGARLVEECVRFARQAGYRKIRLWTQSELVAARRLYKRMGFVRVARKKHDSFSRKGLVAETWDLSL